MTDTRRHPSIEPAHPGALVGEAIESMHVSKAEMARRIGITRAMLYAIIDCRSAVTADMAVRVEAVMGISADLLVRMQGGHDLWRARQASMETA